MVDREVALEALSVLCDANIIRQGQQVAAQQQQLSIKNFIPTVLDADENSQVSRSNLALMRSVLQGGGPAGGSSAAQLQGATFDQPRRRNLIIDKVEFFDPQYDRDFRSLEDTETYQRGGEVYERPCGWYLFGLKVLDKYDGNAWLGTRFRSIESVPEEWPVSYHVTSKIGAEGIVEGFGETETGDRYNRRIYSTPFIAEANMYVKEFIFRGKMYQVVLQNRINPEYRVRHNNGRYWLVRIPARIAAADEEKMVGEAIRPYGLLIREVKQS